MQLPQKNISRKISHIFIFREEYLYLRSTHYKQHGKQMVYFFKRKTTENV